MANVKMSEVGEITDPKLRKVLKPIVRQAELAMEKVAANHHQPAGFPLPKGDKTIEGILRTRFKELPAQAKSRAAGNALSRVAQPTNVRTARFASVGAVDLSSSVAIETQLEKLTLPVKMSISELAAAVAAPVVADPTPNPALNNIEFRIHRVRCIDETNGFLGSEAGSDEIDLGGTEVDESGDTKKISAFRVASFGDDGDVKTFSPPRRLTFFNLREGTAFPKSYFVTLVLAEIDMGGLPDFLNKLLNWVREKVISLLSAAIGGAIGASGGPIGAIIGVAVGWAVGKVFELFKSVWEDDIFEPVTARVDVPTATHRFGGGATDSPNGVAVFSGHGGKYDVTYDWRLF